MTDLNVDALVKTAIEAQIIQAFRDAPEAIDHLVKAVLGEEVNQFGNPPKYGDKKMPYLSYLAGDTIRSVARKAVSDYIVEIEKDIESAVRARLSADDVVNAFVGQISAAAKDDWRITVEFEAEKD